MRGSEKKVTAPVNLIPSELHKFHKGGDARPFLADVDIVCNGGYIPVHSAVLMAGCPMLQEFFASERGSHDDPITIHLLDYSIDDVTAVVVLFYTGSCVVQSRDQMEQVYEILDHLGIRECTTPSVASAEESKKKNFIRRYLVCEDEDDDDMLIEDEEIIAIDDPDGEADDTPNVKQPAPPGPPPSVTLERMDVEKKDSREKKSTKPDRIESERVSKKTDEGKLEGKASEKKKAEEPAQAHTSSTFKVPKVNRDGVKGVKKSVVQNKTKDSSESESESSDDNIKDSKLAKSKKLSITKETTSKRKASRESPKVPPKRPKRSQANKDDDESEFEADSQEEEDDEDEDEVRSESELESVGSKSSTNQQEDGSEDDSSPVPRRKNLRSRPKPKEDSPVFKRLRRRKWKKIRFDDDDDDDEEDNVQNIESPKGQVVHENKKSESTSRRSKAARGDTKESPSKSTSRSSKSAKGDTRESPSKNDNKSKSIPSKAKSSDTSKGPRRKRTNDEEHPSDELDSAECVSLKGLSVLLTRLSREEIIEKTRRRSTDSSNATVRSVSNEKELENGHSRSSSNSDASDVSVNNEQQVPHTSRVQRPSSPAPKSLNGGAAEPPPEVVSITTTSESTALASTSSASRASVDSDTSRPNVELTMERMQRNIRKWRDCVLKCDACPTAHSSYVDSAQCLQRRGSYRCWLCLGIFVTSVTTYEDHCVDVHVYGKPGLGRCPVCHVYIDVNAASSHIIETHLAPDMIEQSQGSAVSTDEPLNESQENSQAGLIRLKPLNQIIEPEDEEQTEEFSESGLQSGSTDQLHSCTTVALAQSGSHLSGGSLTTSRQATAQSQGGVMTGSQIGTESLAEHVSAVVISHGEKDRNEMVRVQGRLSSSHGQVTVATASTSSNSTTTATPIAQGQPARFAQSARPMTTTSASFSNGTSHAGQPQVASWGQTPAPVSHSSTGQTQVASWGQTPAPVSHSSTGQTQAVSRARTPAPISHSTATGQIQAASRVQAPAPVSHSATTGQTLAVPRVQTPAPVGHSTTTAQTQAVSRVHTPAPVSHSATTGQIQTVSRVQTPAPVSHSTTTAQKQAVSRVQTPAPISLTTTNVGKTADEIANEIKIRLKNRQQSTNRQTSNNPVYSQPQTAVRHSSTPQAGHIRGILPPNPTSIPTHGDARMAPMTTAEGLPAKFTLSSGARPRPMPPQSSASNQPVVTYPPHPQQRIPPIPQHGFPPSSREHSGNPPDGLATMHPQGSSGTNPAVSSPGFLAEIGGVPFRVFKRANQNDPNPLPELPTFGEQNNPNSFTQTNMRAVENLQSAVHEVEPVALNQGQLPMVQESSIGIPENRPTSVMPPPSAHTSSGMLVSQPQQSAPQQIASASRPSIPGPGGPMIGSGIFRCVNCAMAFGSQTHLNSHICLED